MEVNRNKEIVRMRQLGKSYPEIGQRYGFSKQRAHFIYKRDRDKYQNNFFWRLVSNLKRMFL